MLTAKESAFWGVVIATGAFLATLAAVRAYISIAPKIGAIANPTRRGSHKVPIATGAGVAIFFVGALFLLILHNIFDSYSGFHAYLLCGFVITVLGFFDDVKPLPLLFRLAFQIVAVLSLVAFTGPPSVLPQAASSLNIIVTTALIVTFMNVFNFMDGSDGIVGLHGLLVMLGWAALALLRTDALLAFSALALAGVFAGFLVLNWHPARVFLGDAGSTLIGFLLVVVPLTGKFGKNDAVGYEMLGIILFSWIFLFDAVFNRFRRLLTKPRFWEPNRDHFYQILVDSGFGQGKTAGLYGGLTTLMILGTIATAIYSGILTLLLLAGSIALPALLWVIVRKKGIDLNTY